MPESIEAARERGADIRAHAARRLTPALVEDADLIVGMAAEHREAGWPPLAGAAARTFTLKELTRLLEARTAADAEPAVEARVGEAAAARASGAPANRLDEDVVDPLGMPLETYRAIAWELDEWIARLVTALYGAVPAASGGRVMRIAMGPTMPGSRSRKISTVFLREQGHEVLDVGTDSTAACRLPAFCAAAARAWSRGEPTGRSCSAGSGQGEQIAANKVHGIRAALCHDLYLARLSREHNDANVLRWAPA